MFNLHLIGDAVMEFESIADWNGHYSTANKAKGRHARYWKLVNNASKGGILSA
jgi:hypothetical protein